MGWYERVVFTRVLELALDQPFVHEERRAALAPASGDVLDIGVGTGLNFPNYPPGVRKLTALTPEPELDPLARRRAEDQGITLEHVSGDATRLPLDRGRFDVVVTTFVLCTIPDPGAAVREFARVLRPGGRLLFLEHVIAPPGPRRFGQRVINPVMKVINCGCSLLCDTKSTITEHGFVITELHEHDVKPMPWPVQHLIRGVAQSTG